MVAMQLAGEKLAAYQNARLLDEPSVLALKEIISNTWLLALAMLALIVAGGYSAWKLNKTLAYGVGGLYLVVAVVLIFFGMAAASPLLILGAFTMLASPSVPYLFNRARELQV
jgi:hypothetical protein